MSFTRDSVRKYYDQNTRLFLTFSNSKKAQNIHRSLWTDGAQTLDEALNVSNARILKEIESVAPTCARCADLGCGVGASLFYIYPRLHEPAPALGLTLSPVQARLARESTEQLGLQDSILFAEGEFTSVPIASEWDAVYSIEAVCHAVEPERYFREAGRLLRRGGRLILVDDFRAAPSLSQAETKWMNAFIDGWHVPGVRTVEQVILWAKKYNLRLVTNDELTPHLRLRNLPNLLARAILFIGNHLPIRHAILASMLGSMALQQCLHMGIVEYRFLVFEKI
jgi:cyclopropane fatty-acyl-phospholipid synthase-like methyltransferase